MSGGLEPVADGGRDGMSLFVFVLNQYLTDHAGDYVTASDLDHHLGRAVANATNSRQNPRCDRIPGAMDMGGEFIFFRVPNGTDPVQNRSDK